MPTTTSSNTQVSFATFTKVHFIARDEPLDKYYTQDDFDRFSREALAEARRLRKVLQELPMGASLGYEDFCECMGIEKYLSRDLLRVSIERRRLHARAVLASQNSRMLSSVSERTSCWGRQRAHDVAKMYEMLQE